MSERKWSKEVGFKLDEDTVKLKESPAKTK